MLKLYEPYRDPENLIIFYFLKLRYEFYKLKSWIRIRGCAYFCGSGSREPKFLGTGIYLERSLDSVALLSPCVRAPRDSNLLATILANLKAQFITRLGKKGQAFITLSVILRFKKKYFSTKNHLFTHICPLQITRDTIKLEYISAKSF